jgi:SAM-dependent methyltransferase
VPITASQEKAFYDQQYAPHLAAPDHALRCSKADMGRFLDDPAHPLYERRRLYQAALAELTRLPLSGLRVLDYGCGPSDWGVMMATEGAQVTLLDLSETAIQLGLKRARANGVAHLVTGVARDASDLSCFADASFDLVFANAALHHTLKYPGAWDELLRVMARPSRLVLAETLGNNPMLNLARRVRAALSRQQEEQGEEIILGDPELALIGQSFQLDVSPFHLLAMAKRLLRGRFRHAYARTLLAALEAADSLLLSLAPPLRRFCGEALILGRRY